jgi:hypothetical protein
MDEEQQMNAMMGAERVDPVSGNEVPPGAMPEEVRDDVPAMLSEGEYVVPADVLRYYGVRFFEELREKAKQEMGHMEAEGRTGKEMDADEAMPFSMEELNVVEEPDMPMEEGMNKGGYVKGYAEGGVVIDPSVGNMVLPDFLEGVSIAGKTSQEYKTYKNDAGLTMTVRFVNGKPTAYIPPGYTEVSATDTVKATDTTTTETKVEEQKGSGGEFSKDADTGPSISEMTGGQLAQAQKDLDANKALMGKVPGVIGLLGKVLNNIEQKQIDKRADALGLEPQKAVTVTATSGPTAGKSRSLMAGPSYATQDLAGIKTAAAMTDAQKAAGQAYADKGDARDTSWGGGYGAGGGEVAEASDVSHDAASASAASAAAGWGGGARGGRATGGLVTKRTYKKKK